MDTFSFVKCYVPFLTPGANVVEVILEAKSVGE